MAIIITMQGYSFNINNRTARAGIADGLRKLFDNYIPIIVCVGTDAAIGDSLGPIIGTKLKEKSLPAFIYGSLDSTVTAKEVKTIGRFIKNAHPLSKVLVIDAAVGLEEDIGMIRVINDGIRPGLGAEKDLPKLGDGAIMGIVSPRSKGNNSFMTTTRLSPIYKMAEVIANGVCDYVLGCEQKPAYRSVK